MSVNLPVLGEDLLVKAHTARSGRAAETVRGHGDRLRQTVIALTAGTELADHDSPEAATLQVIIGRVRLTVPEPGDDQAELSLRAGDLADIPPVRHGLHAESDAVVLLTVAQ